MKYTILEIEHITSMFNRLDIWHVCIDKDMTLMGIASLIATDRTNPDERFLNFLETALEKDIIHLDMYSCLVEVTHTKRYRSYVKVNLFYIFNGDNVNGHEADDLNANIIKGVG